MSTTSALYVASQLMLPAGKELELHLGRTTQSQLAQLTLHGRRNPVC